MKTMPQQIKPLRGLLMQGVLDQFNLASPIAKGAHEAKLRESRARHPDGKFDKGGRWYPSVEEEQACCVGIRAPSRSWQYSLMLHCRSINHVATLFGVSTLNLKREKKRQEAVDQEVQLPIVARLNPIAIALTATIRTFSKSYEPNRRNGQ